ncbi:MAG TPA: hypothetical protein VE957_18915 [Terriglobales bacterium]|nr:hypothetical protein [Terriglobales bacterium]
MRTETRTNVKEHFAGLFTEPFYDGSYHTPLAEHASESFRALTDGVLMWTQVHGDFKDAVKRALFKPYPHWPELYDACQSVVRAHADLGTEWWGPLTGAKLMGDAMTVLRDKHGQSVPKWWLPIASNNEPPAWPVTRRTCVGRALFEGAFEAPSRHVVPTGQGCRADPLFISQRRSEKGKGSNTNKTRFRAWIFSYHLLTLAPMR